MTPERKTITTAQDCIFCKIITGIIPSTIIDQTNLSIVIQDIAPQAPIHYLIIPKKHVQDLASCSSDDAELLADMMLLAKKISVENKAATAFKLITNNGYAAGQRVFHLHFHFLAGTTFSS